MDFYKFPHYSIAPISYELSKMKKNHQWIQDMANTPQDSIHHAEGNVLIHTQMVLNKLIELPEFKSLSIEDQHILFASALFHDVEKRSTTIEENGRISSPGHAKKGEISTRSILYREFETPFLPKEKISKLVRYHGLPIWIFDKVNSQKAIIESSLVCNNFLLSLLAKADMLGRICLDQDDMLYRIDLFKEYALEQNCFSQPKNFSDSFSKFSYFEKEEISPDYPIHNDTSCNVTIMSGLPGTGKDYFIEHNLHGLPVVSIDKIRLKYKIDPNDKYATGFAIQMAKEEARTYLRKKQDFVWNGMNITKQIRQQVVGLCREYNAYVTIKYLEVPYKTLLTQNKNREHVVKESVLERFINKLEVPSLTEAHEVEYFESSKKQTLNNYEYAEKNS